MGRHRRRRAAQRATALADHVAAFSGFQIDLRALRLIRTANRVA